MTLWKPLKTHWRLLSQKNARLCAGQTDKTDGHCDTLSSWQDQKYSSFVLNLILIFNVFREWVVGPSKTKVNFVTYEIDDWLLWQTSHLPGPGLWVTAFHWSIPLILASHWSIPLILVCGSLPFCCKLTQTYNARSLMETLSSKLWTSAFKLLLFLSFDWLQLVWIHP